MHADQRDLEALALRVAAIETRLAVTDLSEALDLLREIRQAVREAHRREMAKIDQETNDLAAQIEGLKLEPAGAVTQDQVNQLGAVLGKLKEIGKRTPTNP